MLTLKDIRKDYGEGEETVHALQGVTLHFRPHEFVAILGPSGCGKTTLLNIIGGLDHYTDGDLVIAGTSTKEYKDKDWDSYRNHRVGFVFQSYNLIPHQSVLANVELALTLSGVSRTERRARAAEALARVGLGNQIKKKPNQMSGGQMQRVAIARALVNNPEIVLADEPTGALDTQTSVQIMDILKEISSEKLIVMVTHNPELAEKYASRIIRVRDGCVVDDSNPYDGVSEEREEVAAPYAVTSAEEAAANEIEGKKRKKERGSRPKKTSMSFFTALQLSLNNLMTKKTRTFLTSFAGSIGIIGIALVLALSNGIQVFIDKVQEDTLSSYPITVESGSVDLNAALTAFAGSGEDREYEDGYVYSNDQLANLSNAMLAGYRENDLKAFREYLESDASSIKDNGVVQYRWGVTPQVYVRRNGKYYAVSPSKIVSNLMRYMGMDSMSGMSVWDEMIDSPELLQSQYDLLSGRWPSAYNEVVLVTDKNRGISDLMLYALGIKDPDEFEKLFSTEGIGAPAEERYTYADLMNLEFRMVLAADYYTKRGDQYTDARNDTAELNALLDSESKYVPIKVVGIIAASPDATATSISGAVGYTSALTDYIMEQTLSQNADGTYKHEVVQDQLANPTRDVISGKPFYIEDTSSDEEKAQKLVAFLSDPANVNEWALQYEKNLSDIVFFNLYMGDGTSGALPQVMMTYSREDENSPQNMRVAIGQLLEEDPALFYRLQRKFPEMIPESVTPESFRELLNTMTSYDTLAPALAALKVFYNNTYDDAYTVAYAALAAMTTQDKGDAYRAYAQTIAASGAASAAALWDTYLKTGTSSSTYKRNLSLIGVADRETPTAVYIYPKSFDSKEAISKEITSYNEAHPNGEITYTDYIGIMLKSVSTILSVITYVLVAFVGISLVVSSIMIGIITYISVLERIKEIGILRAIGASKRDVSHVFLAETLIVGFTAGMIGILVTLLLSIPINIIIRHLSGFSNIGASLPVLGAVILVLISMLLTLIAGLLPARIAAKKEPVEALRSE